MNPDAIVGLVVIVFVLSPVVGLAGMAVYFKWCDRKGGARK